MHKISIYLFVHWLPPAFYIYHLPSSKKEVKSFYWDWLLNRFCCHLAVMSELSEVANMYFFKSSEDYFVFCAYNQLSLPLLPGPLWPEVGVPIRIPSILQWRLLLILNDEVTRLVFSIISLLDDLGLLHLVTNVLMITSILTGIDWSVVPYWYYHHLEILLFKIIHFLKLYRHSLRHIIYFLSQWVYIAHQFVFATSIF